MSNSFSIVVLISGLGTTRPSWQIAVQGDYNQSAVEGDSFENWIGRGDWFVTPSVHWSAEDFSLSAGVQMSLDLLRDDIQEAPDYRIRADFRQHF